MKIENLIEELSSDEKRNEALSFLYTVMLETDDDGLTSKLTELIENPQTIENTNRFTALLENINSETFIEPLIKEIAKSTPADTSWLADYMYALGSLLMDREDLWPAEQAFVDLLGNWLLSTGGGEISWKAGVILAHLKNPNTRQYLFKGARRQELFHQTRIACINGIINQYRPEASEVLHDLSTDTDQCVRESVAHALEWLKKTDAESGKGR
ncbi:MAG: hypothetical protein HZB62_15090 [Nitrospirae bacterium]|nr:hypothetical protein [Nitrospirota bacterium]